MIWDDFSNFKANCAILTSYILADPRTCRGHSRGCCHQIVRAAGFSCRFSTAMAGNKARNNIQGSYMQFYALSQWKRWDFQGQKRDTQTGAAHDENTEVKFQQTWTYWVVGCCGPKASKFRELRTPFPLVRHTQKTSQHIRACATGDGAICSKIRLIVPLHGDSPNTRNSARSRSPSPIMAPVFAAKKRRDAWSQVRLLLFWISRKHYLTFGRGSGIEKKDRNLDEVFKRLREKGLNLKWEKNQLRWHPTPNDRFAFAPFYDEAFHKNSDKLYIFWKLNKWKGRRGGLMVSALVSRSSNPVCLYTGEFCVN